MTMISVVVGAIKTVSKGSAKRLEELEIRGRIDTIQTTVFLRSARILRRVLESWRNLLSLNLQWKIINKHWCEKLARREMIIMNLLKLMVWFGLVVSMATFVGYLMLNPFP